MTIFAGGIGNRAALTFSDAPKMKKPCLIYFFLFYIEGEKKFFSSFGIVSLLR